MEWHSQGSERARFRVGTTRTLPNSQGDHLHTQPGERRGTGAAEDPVLANVASVVNEQVYGLGLNSFRIDKYSATEIVDGVVADFGG